MRSSLVLLLVLGTGLPLAPTPVAAQGLVEALTARITFDLKGRRPTADTDGWRFIECQGAGPPDSVALVTTGVGSVPLATWMRVRYGSEVQNRWSPIGVSTVRPDTLRAALVALNCASPGRPNLLVESDGWYAEVFGVDLPWLYTADTTVAFAADALKSLKVYLIGAEGALGRAVYYTPERTSDITYTLMTLGEAMSQNRAADSTTEARRAAAIRAKRWPTRVTKHVIAREVSVGMTGEMVRLAWGKPRTINKTMTAGSTREQWVYSDAQYVYLTNGIVSGVQTSE